jgi:hypothetical protein
MNRLGGKLSCVLACASLSVTSHTDSVTPALMLGTASIARASLARCTLRRRRQRPGAAHSPLGHAHAATRQVGAACHQVTMFNTGRGRREDGKWEMFRHRNY